MRNVRKIRLLRTIIVVVIALMLAPSLWVDASGDSEQSTLTAPTLSTQEAPKGVYLNPYSGNDSRNGLTQATAVKTFDRAAAIWKNNDSIEVIYMVQALWTNGNVELKSPDPNKAIPLYRYGSTGSMIVVQSGKLTLDNVILDGQKDVVGSARYMVYVYPGATLEITGEQTELRNSSATITENSVIEFAYRGGAVCCLGNLIMTGGSIHDNEAGMGGGVYVGRNKGTDPNPTFDMSGGSIYNNRTVNVSTNGSRNSHDYYSGGGVMLGAYATMDMHGDAVIRDNRSVGWGGGISLGNLSYNNSSISYNNCTLNMYQDEGSNLSPIISGNSARRGGGIFVQGMNTANLSAGLITGNRSLEATTMPTGGGIYVNGDHNRNIHSGVLNLTNVEMTGNSATGQGGAIMGCASSATYVRDVSGAVIYGNSSGNKSQVAYTLANAGSVSKRWEDSTLSDYMLGGGSYRWFDAITKDDLTWDALQHTYDTVHADSKAMDADIQKGVSLAKLHINNNQTNGGGGGAIGNNGVVNIGVYGEMIDIEVTKKWENDISEDRPSAIRLILLKDGEELDSKVMERDASGTWPSITFENLLKYRLNPDGSASSIPCEYTVKEDPTYTAADGSRLSEDYKVSLEKGTETSVRYAETEDAGAKDMPGATYDSATNLWKYPVTIEKWTLTNTYEKPAPAPAMEELTGQKVLQDHRGRQVDVSSYSELGFVFRLQDANDPETEGYDMLRAEAIADEDGKFAFNVEFNKPGIYRFKAAEDPARDGSTIVHDDTVYDIIYTVLPDLANNQLVAKCAILKDGQEVDGVRFINRYKDPGPPVGKGYTITYDLNGGNYNGNTEDVKEFYYYGTIINIRKAPVREGYQFLYWEGSRYDPGDKYTVTEDHTFVARWKKLEPGTVTPVDPEKKAKPTATGDDASLGAARWLAVLGLLVMLTAVGHRVIAGRR